jgi:membrane dipeptidase
VMEHVEYCIDVMGIDHVGFGLDTFFGDHVGLHRAYGAFMDSGEDQSTNGSTTSKDSRT